MDSTARLGPYEIRGFLTEVGLDDLYLGTDTRCDREILLRLLTVFLDEEDTIERLRRRARRIAAVDHPHLLPLSRVEKSDGPVLAVAERAPGRALDRFVPAGGLSHADVLAMSATLSSALAAIHRENLVHGYLHAGRIIVSDDGELKLLVIGPEERTNNPGPRAASCLAPEVFEGGEIDRRAEVFALGVLLHQIAVGKAPFDAPTTAVIREAVRRDSIPRVTEQRSDLPDAFARIVRRCLEKNRDRRYATADDVHRDLLALPGARAPVRQAALAADPEVIADNEGKEADGTGPRAQPWKVLTGSRSASSIPSTAPSIPEARPAFNLAPDPDLDAATRPVPLWRPALAADDRSRASAAEESAAADVEDDGENEASAVEEPVAADVETDAADTASAVDEPMAVDVEADVADRAAAVDEPMTVDIEADAADAATTAGEAAEETADPRQGVAARAADRPATRMYAAAHASRWSDWRQPGAYLLLLTAGLVIGWLGRGLGGDGDAVAGEPLLQPATATAGPELFPRLSPDGARLYYARAEDGDWGIYAQDVGGDDAVELTADSPFGDHQPALSADGTRIAFRSERNGGGIFLMKADGSAVRRIADFGHNPSWSPDGEELAVASSPVYDAPHPGAQGEIVAVDTSSGGQRPIAGANGLQPAWSPDGGRIAYWSSRGTTATDLWTIPANGGEPVAVTDDSAIDWSPVWSPDGNHLYFVSNRGGADNIWRVGIDASSGTVLGAPEPVTTAGGVRTLHPSFASASGTMVYIEAVARRGLYRIPLDPSSGTASGEPELVPGIPRNAWAPDIASDAGRLAFLLPVGNRQQLWTGGADGSSAAPLSDAAASAHKPRLSPDGRTIAFLSDQSGSLQLWTAPVGGGVARRHTELTTRVISQPTWSRDGSAIGMSVGGAMMPSYTLLFDPAQTHEQQVADTLLSTPSDATFEPHSWSRDGARIAGSIRRADGRLAGIAVLPVGAGEHEMIVDFGMHPVWLRDGRRLLFQWGSNIYRVDSRSPEPRVVYTSVPDALGEVFALSSDDRWIYVSLERKEADAWLLSR